MNILPLPSLGSISKIFSYSPDEGVFLWLERPDQGLRWNRRFAGKPAFTNRNMDGYCISVFTNPDNGRRAAYLAHRIAWVFLTGSSPKLLIDHINGDRTDNRACNLREATPHQNKMNQRTRRSGTSKFIGVHRHSQNGSWIAQVRWNGKTHHVGSFPTEMEAAIARDRVARQAMGDFANLNFP